MHRSRCRQVRRGRTYNELWRMPEVIRRRTSATRAILMLLAICGMRSGEIRSLRLEQIDWPGRVLRVFRLKRRQPQVYPLLQTVAEAVARYIDTARPKAAHPEIFLGLLAPGLCEPAVC